MNRNNKCLILFCLSMVIFAACDMEQDITKDDEKKNNRKKDGPQVEIIDGAVQASFSVSADKQVYFSQGNLQYQASTNTWRFAENQWDYVGTQIPDPYGGSFGGTVENGDNSYISKDYDGWIDLFGWGTSGWKGGVDSCQPYSISYMHKDYIVGGSEGNSLTGEFANADWGVYNAITNGGNKAGLWRTLSRDEWNYLIFERPRADSLCSAAVVNGVRGLVVLPDGWQKPWYVLFTPHHPNWCSNDCNQYGIYDWEDMQATGAIFLPVTGLRNKKEVQRAGDACYYWTTTASSLSGQCCALYVFSDEIHTDYTFGRGSGLSVRLVQDVQ